MFHSDIGRVTSSNADVTGAPVFKQPLNMLLWILFSLSQMAKAEKSFQHAVGGFLLAASGVSVCKNLQWKRASPCLEELPTHLKSFHLRGVSLAFQCPLSNCSCRRGFYRSCQAEHSLNHLLKSELLFADFFLIERCGFFFFPVSRRFGQIMWTLIIKPAYLPNRNWRWSEWVK